MKSAYLYNKDIKLNESRKLLVFLEAKRSGETETKNGIKKNQLL